MLNDAKVASVRFLIGKVWATRISEEKKFEPHFQVNLGICWTIRASTGGNSLQKHLVKILVRVSDQATKNLGVGELSNHKKTSYL